MSTDLFHGKKKSSSIYHREKMCASDKHVITSLSSYGPGCVCLSSTDNGGLNLKRKRRQKITEEHWVMFWETIHCAGSIDYHFPFLQQQKKKNK